MGIAAIRKLPVALLLMLLLSYLTACSMLKELQINELEESDIMANKIVDALNSSDSSALTALFSKNAQREASDIAEGINYIFSVFQGSSVSVERHGTVPEQHYDSYGKSVTVYGRYDVLTEKDSYTLSFDYYIIDKHDANSEGLFRLRFVTEEKSIADFEKFSALRRVSDEAQKESDTYIKYPVWNYGASYKRPGIYWPGWDDGKFAYE